MELESGAHRRSALFFCGKIPQTFDQRQGLPGCGSLRCSKSGGNTDEAAPEDGSDDGMVCWAGSWVGAYFGADEGAFCADGLSVP